MPTTKGPWWPPGLKFTRGASGRFYAVGAVPSEMGWGRLPEGAMLWGAARAEDRGSGVSYGWGKCLLSNTRFSHWFL